MVIRSVWGYILREKIRSVRGFNVGIKERYDSRMTP